MPYMAHELIGSELNSCYLFPCLLENWPIETVALNSLDNWYAFDGFDGFDFPWGHDQQSFVQLIVAQGF